MTVRELLTKIGFEVDEKPLNHVEEKLEQIKQRLEIFAAAEVVKGLFELTERFAHLGEELNVAAHSAGISVEAFQKLAFAAQMSAVSQEQMQHGMALLSRKLYEAKTGSEEAGKAFRKAGISGEQIKGFKTSQDALYALADRFSKIKDPIARMGQAQELLGRGGYQMVAFLAKGSKAIREQGDEAQRLGLILSGPQVEALEEVEHSFARLFALIKAVSASIASYIGPAFTFLVDKFVEFFAVNREIISLNFENWLKNVAYAMGFMIGLSFALIQKLVDLAKAFHLEGAILPTIAMIASLGLGFIAFVKTTNMMITFAREMVVAWEAVLPVLQALKAYIIGIQASTVLWTLGIAAVIIAGHDLYALFSGKPTWIGQFWEWLTSLNAIKVALAWISDTWASIKGGSADLLAKAEGFLGIGTANAATPGERLASISSPGAALSSISNSATTFGGSSSSQISAPVSISITGATDPKEVAVKVREGIQDHFGQLSREMDRSTLNPVAH